MRHNQQHIDQVRDLWVEKQVPVLDECVPISHSISIQATTNDRLVAASTTSSNEATVVVIRKQQQFTCLKILPFLVLEREDILVNEKNVWNRNIVIEILHTKSDHPSVSKIMLE